MKQYSISVIKIKSTVLFKDWKSNSKNCRSAEAPTG